MAETLRDMVVSLSLNSDNFSANLRSIVSGQKTAPRVVRERSEIMCPNDSREFPRILKKRRDTEWEQEYRD